MSTNWGPRTTADEVATAFSERIKGKTVLITGVSPGGLGATAAIAISKHAPSLIILANRDVAKASQTASDIAAAAPQVSTRILELNLSSLKSVRAAAAEVNGYAEEIDVLINNAGVMCVPYGKTEDGFETHFGINHLGHFLFTSLIFNKLKQGARVVNVSSNGHRRSDIRYEDPNFEKGDYDKLAGYGQSKTANMLFTVALAKKAKHKGIQTYSLQPGVADTNLGRHMSTEEIDGLKSSLPAHMALMKSISECSATHIVAAFDPSIAENNGAFLNDCKVAPPLAEYATDPQNADKLWAFSEELLGEKFKL